MQLLFFWVRRYGPIKKQLLSFSNEHRFQVDEIDNGECIRLSVEDNPDYIPGLWHKNIKSITGLFGKNGSGKTTVLDFISSNLPDGAGHLLDGCAIGVQDKDRCTIWISDKDSSWELKDSTTARMFELQILDSKDLSEESMAARRRTSIIYYTPGHWPLGALQELSGPYTNFYGFHDISTSYLLQHDTISFANSEKPIEAKASGPSQLLAHRFQSWRREMSFLASPYSSELGYPIPQHVTVSINPYERDRLVDNPEMQKLLKTFGLGEKPAINEDYRRQFKDDVYRAMIFNLFYATRESLSSFTLPHATDITGSTTLQKCLNLLTRIASNKMNIFRDTAQSMIDFADYYESCSDSFMNIQSVGGASISTQLGESDTFTEFFQKYSKTITITDYLIFSWEYRLSSGEQSLLTLYSRLWMLADKPSMQSREPPRNVKLRNDVILLLDEADSYFHPEWQRQLYKRLIEFLPKIYGNRNIQIVFAANNPYQLSDMFRFQTNFLNEKGCVVQHHEDLHQTFAGNIHYLLSDSFFMGDCLMGEFAAEKIKELAIWLGSERQTRSTPKWLNTDSAEIMIEQIGERILRDKLRDMLAYRFPEKFKTKLIKLRLDEVEKKRRILLEELKQSERRND